MTIIRYIISVHKTILSVRNLRQFLKNTSFLNILFFISINLYGFICLEMFLYLSEVCFFIYFISKRNLHLLSSDSQFYKLAHTFDVWLVLFIWCQECIKIVTYNHKSPCWDMKKKGIQIEIYGTYTHLPENYFWSSINKVLQIEKYKLFSTSS